MGCSGKVHFNIPHNLVKLHIGQNIESSNIVVMSLIVNHHGAIINVVYPT